MKKQSKKTIKSARKPRQPKPKKAAVEMLPVAAQEDPPKDWIDRLLDRLEKAWRAVFRA